MEAGVQLDREITNCVTPVGNFLDNIAERGN